MRGQGHSKKGHAERDGSLTGNTDTGVNTIDGAALGVRCGMWQGQREQRNRGWWNRRVEKHRHGKPERLQKETRPKAESLAGV